MTSINGSNIYASPKNNEQEKLKLARKGLKNFINKAFWTTEEQAGFFAAAITSGKPATPEIKNKEAVVVTCLEIEVAIRNELNSLIQKNDDPGTLPRKRHKHGGQQRGGRS